MNLSPIILFVYNRPWHTRQTIEALQKNVLADKSELFIYSDAAKNEDAKENVREVREYLETIDGFKKVTIIKREKNWGLSNSIIDGVTNIVNKYGKIIVLEDDLVTSKYFLKFMNEALDFYADEDKVWHVSGWNYPIETDDLEDVFLWRVMNCWGWATWADRWQHFEKDVNKTINEFSKKDIKKFNLDGSEDFFGQIKSNYEKKINTWAIFWYATLFKKDGLCLNPSQTFVENIGHDGSGIHCANNKEYLDELSTISEINFTQDISENGKTIFIIKKYLKKSIFKKIKRFIKWK